jgi:protein-tyrosine phosphatase
MCDDDAYICPYFASAIDFIKDSFNFKMNVLVHCKEGDCKSATIVVAYLMYKYKMKWERAVEVVKSRRPSMNITEGLLNQL